MRERGAFSARVSGTRWALWRCWGETRRSKHHARAAVRRWGSKRAAVSFCRRLESFISACRRGSGGGGEGGRGGGRRVGGARGVGWRGWGGGRAGRRGGWVWG